MDQVLLWGQFDTTCSHGRQQLGWSNQRLYLQQRLQLHSILRAYLQTLDWILLQSMSLDPSDYGWTLGVHGYEPVPTVDPMAPEELLQFTSCNCNGDCNNRRCSCKKNVSIASQHVEFVKALHARMVFMMVLKKTQTLTPEAFDMVDQYLQSYATNWNKWHFICKCRSGRGSFSH